MPPFLEVLTRTFNGRPKMFAAQQISLAAQTDRDFVHTVLVDTERLGIEHATELMAGYADKLVGSYVWILDDDDLCTLPTFIAGLKEIAVLNAPDLIMCRMDHGGGRILPSARWGKSPRVSEIGISAFVVRREVWQQHAKAFVPGAYTSDFKFIKSIWDSRPQVYWWDVVASRCQRQSVGLAEHEVAA
jgi:hypothetical protein